MQVLGTFQSRDVADSVKDAFVADGFRLSDLIVMVNREEKEPPEDARLETGSKGEGGLGGVEEKVGKAVLSLLGKETTMEGDGSEGTAKGGALLGITVASDVEAERAVALLKRHQAADIETAQPD